MAYTGWFPCFSPDGEHVLTGTGDLWIDASQNVGQGYMNRWGANSVWTSNNTILYLCPNVLGTDTDYRLWTCQVGGTPANLGIVAGFSEFAVAVGGRWAGWIGSGIRTSWGTTIAGARGPGVTASSIAYILDWGLDIQRLMLDGVLVNQAPLTTVQMSAQALCWIRWDGPLGYDPWGMRLDVVDTPHSIQASDVMEYGAVPIDTPGGPWVLSYESARLILRPFNDTSGYVVATGETMYPSGVYRTSVGQFRIGWSTSAGVYQEAYIDPSDARVPLGGTVDPEVPDSTLPGNPGATSTAGTVYPPLRHPMTDPETGLVSKPWAAWFEAQQATATSWDFSTMPAQTLIGRGSTGAGFASTIRLGTGLQIRDTTMQVNLTDILPLAIQYGTRAEQPAATTVPVGTLYGVSDENVIERSNGTTWDPFGSV